MRSANQNFPASAVSLAVRGALIAMFVAPVSVLAADESVASLTTPNNFVEIGASHVSRSSAKFGEYNGQNKSGTDLIGNFSVSGGDAYGNGEAYVGTGTTRWNVTGTDLGTTSRSLSGDVSNQGQWKLSVGYDELRHNISDTYQTYLQGSMGGNTFTAPATFGRINGGANPASRGLDANQLGAFRTEDIGSTRKNSSFAAGMTLTPQLSLKFDFNRLDQSGAKLLGSGAAGQTIGGIAYRAEAVAILMNPTNYQTDNFNLGLNWVGDKGHLTTSYFGSVFKDGYDRFSWDNVQAGAAAGICASGGACTYQSTTMSTAPGNSFHQLNLVGGYALSSATKLVGGLSYGRNRQNDSFLTGLPEIVSSPASLNGLVVTKHADMKLTHRANKDISLSAAFKYNERDNRTPSNIYQFYAINNVNRVATNLVDAATNAPYSNKKTQLELAGDYRIDKSQSLRLAYDYEKVSRWCDSMANGFDNCVVTPTTKENKLALKYKLKAADDLNFNAGYTYSKRQSTFDHDAVTPLSGLDTLTPDDVNGQNYPGFLAYVYAPRKQDMVKAGATWQAAERVELGVNGRYANDKYSESTLGVQKGRTAGIDLDATYSYAEGSTVSAYASWQNSKRDLRSGAAPGTATGLTPTAVGQNAAGSYALLVAPTNIWTNQLNQIGNAIGINTKHQGLMGGKLELKADLSYSFDKTAYSTQVGYPIIGCNATTGNNTNCGDLPDVTSKVLTLKLIGTYDLDKSAKVRFGYVYQQRKSDDYYYYTALYGQTPNRVMPTNELAPNYSVSMVAASYIFTFK